MDSVSHPNTFQDLAHGNGNGNGDEIKPEADDHSQQDVSGSGSNGTHFAMESFGNTQSPSEDESHSSMEMRLAAEDAQGNSATPNTKLIVNYLPQTLSDDEFRGMFLSCGTVKTSKICRDRETGFSYGFGFVEFVNVADAAKAIELLNGHVMGHKRLKVAYSRPPNREMHEANLYMRGLPKSWDEEKLKEYCSKYGQIIQVRVLKDQNTGSSRGTGFVLFNRKSEADACRTEMNGIVLPDCTEPLVVKVAEGPGGNEQKVRPPPGVGIAPPVFLPPHVAHPHAMQFQPAAAMPSDRYFQQPYGMATAPVGGPLRTGTSTPRMRYNPMMASSMKMHMSKQAPSAVGYPAAGANVINPRIPFPAANVASTAEMVGLNTPILPVAGSVPRPVARPPVPGYPVARAMPVAPPSFPPAPPPPPPPPSAQHAQFDPNDPAAQAANGAGYQLFVYNCGTTCGENELYELFGPYGVVSKIDVVRDPMNGNTKFAFVTMPDYNAAAAAVQALNGYCYTPRPLQVKFKVQPPTPTR